MDHGADLHIIEGKKWAFHLSLTREFREGFDWKSGAPEPKDFLAYNNLAGFGLSSVPVPGYRAFPNTLAILDCAVSKFYVSTEVAMDKVGYFMDPNMCFAENGTIAGVALVLAGAPHDLTGPVMGLWGMASSGSPGRTAAGSSSNVRTSSQSQTGGLQTIAGHCDEYSISTWGLLWIAVEARLGWRVFRLGGSSKRYPIRFVCSVHSRGSSSKGHKVFKKDPWDLLHQTDFHVQFGACRDEASGE